MSGYGKVALVGAGPGDAGLLTVRGAELLKRADCVVYDRLLNKDFLELTKDNCEKIYVGKENHHHTMPQDEINQLLFDKAKECELVVRLKGGDPYVFGRGGEEALFLNDKDVNVEVVPGISSSVAAAALAGIPVTHRGLSKGFQVITAHSKADALSSIDFSKLTDEDITLVFLMGLSHVGEISGRLMDAGRAADTEIAVVSNAATPHQKKCIGTLSNIVELVEKAALKSPAVIVVGKVVSLSDTLSFFEKRPLFGRKFFLPEIEKYEYSWDGTAIRLPNELKKMLEGKGADVVIASAGRITPVKVNLDFIEEVGGDDYIAFTSASGVNAFIFNLITSGKRDIRFLPQCRFAAIGEKTAKALLKYGIRADEVSDSFNSSDFAENLKEKVDDKATVYWLCGKKRSDTFEESLSKKVSVKEIVCYENVADTKKLTEEEIEEIKSCDASILTCGSNARYAVSQLDKLPGEIYSIGPSCSKVLESLGVNEYQQAEISSYEGIMSVVVNSKEV